MDTRGQLDGPGMLYGLIVGVTVIALVLVGDVVLRAQIPSQDITRICNGLWGCSAGPTFYTIPVEYWTLGFVLGAIVVMILTRNDLRVGGGGTE